MEFYKVIHDFKVHTYIQVHPQLGGARLKEPPCRTYNPVCASDAYLRQLIRYLQ